VKAHYASRQALFTTSSSPREPLFWFSVCNSTWSPLSN